MAGPRIGDVTANETTGSIERITDGDSPAGPDTQPNTAAPPPEPPSTSVKEASAKAEAAAARAAAALAALDAVQAASKTSDTAPRNDGAPGTTAPGKTAPGKTAPGATAKPSGTAKPSSGKGSSAGDSSGAIESSGPAEELTPGKRVRVVLSQRKGTATRPVRTVVDVQELTQVGELLSASLIRSQLALALRIGGVVTIALGSLPAIFVIFPVLGRVELFGVRLPWLLLGLLSYPFMLALGYLHAKSAERLEQVFADHIQS